jgi:hypothetical protein
MRFVEAGFAPVGIVGIELVAAGRSPTSHAT